MPQKRYGILFFILILLFSFPAAAEGPELEARSVADVAGKVGLYFLWNPEEMDEDGFALPHMTFRDTVEIEAAWRDDGVDELGWHVFSALDQGPVEDGEHEYQILVDDLWGDTHSFSTRIQIGEVEEDAGAGSAGDVTTTTEPSAGVQPMCSYTATAAPVPPWFLFMFLCMMAVRFMRGGGA